MSTRRPHAHDPAATHPRRAFLRRLGGGAASLALPTWLAACSGGGGDNPGDASEGGNGGGNGGGQPVDDRVRAASIAAVEDHCRALAQQARLTPLAFVEAVAARLRTDPAYVETGVDAATLCAWGVFADGRVHVIANNFKPPRKPAAAPVTAAPDEGRAHAAALADLPAAATARVMQSFGPLFDCADVVTDLVGWLKGRGWQVPQGAEQRADVSTLRGIRGAGYFYINTHGGAFTPTLFPGSGQCQYAIQSSTLVSPAQEALPETIADMAARRLTYFTAGNGDPLLGIFSDWDTRYGITANFVETYWKFAADSVVIINACSSARNDTSAWSAGFVLACHKVGAGVYFGWNETVSPLGAFRAARYLTDRLLGANQFKPETIPQRAFPWDAVMADLRKRGFHTDPDVGAQFQALPGPSLTSKPLLAPSIRHVEVDELFHELALVGYFGKVPGEVTIDARPCTVKQWQPERVVVALPLTGTGSKGPVQVSVRGVRSNLRQLTQWTVPIDYTYVVMEAFGPKIDGLGTVRLRADVGLTRDAPGEEPKDQVHHAYDTSDSQLPLTASGQMPTPQCTLYWEGHAVYKAFPEVGWPTSLMAYLKLDRAGKKAWLGLGLGSPSPNFSQLGCPGGKVIEPNFGTLDVPVSFPSPVGGGTDMIPLHALALALDDKFVIAPGRNENPVARVIWPQVVPSFAPQASDAV